MLTTQASTNSILSLAVRYQREFGFVISGRPIVVDDIRVRGIGKTEVDLETPVEVATAAPRIETVSGLCVRDLRKQRYFMGSSR